MHSQLTFPGLNNYYEDSFRFSFHVTFVQAKPPFNGSMENAGPGMRGHGVWKTWGLVEKAESGGKRKV